MKRKEDSFDYFEQFVRYSEKCYESGCFVKTCLSTFRKENFPKQLLNMHKMEQEADEFYHLILTHLSKEFLPPIDREDIITIVQKFDDIMDAMDELMNQVYIYNIASMCPGTTTLCDLLIQMLNTLKKLTVELAYYKKSKKLKGYMASINELESKADNLYTMYIHKLFAEEHRELKIIKWKAVYDAFEQCFDLCEDLSDLMELVILKNK